jgi:hypothetical protein
MEMEMLPAYYGAAAPKNQNKKVTRLHGMETISLAISRCNKQITNNNFRIALMANRNKVQRTH